MEPIFNALFDQLEVRNRDQFAFSALLRHREVLGPEGFNRYSNKIDARQKNTFKRMESSHENKGTVIQGLSMLTIVFETTIKNRKKFSAIFGILVFMQN